MGAAPAKKENIMADDDLPEEENLDEEDEKDEDREESAPAKGSKKKLIIGLMVVLLLVVGGGSAAFFLGAFDFIFGGPKTTAIVALPEPPEPPVMYSFPPMLVDLKTGACRSNYLKFEFILEVSESYTAQIKKLEPKLIEAFQMHLREQERKDLVGRAGSDRLRKGLLRIVDANIRPNRAESIIFKQFILQ